MAMVLFPYVILSPLLLAAILALVICVIVAIKMLRTL